jgi:hypothetical protein
MFFIALITAAMLTWSWGSNRTTCTCESMDSGIADHEREVAISGETVPTKVDELTGRAAEHELASPALAIGRGFVHHHAEEERHVGYNPERSCRKNAAHGISAACPLPLGRHDWRARFGPSGDAHTVARELGHEEPGGLTVGRNAVVGRSGEVQLDAVAVGIRFSLSSGFESQTGAKCTSGLATSMVSTISLRSTAIETVAVGLPASIHESSERRYCASWRLNTSGCDRAAGPCARRRKQS